MVGVVDSCMVFMVPLVLSLPKDGEKRFDRLNANGMCVQNSFLPGRHADRDRVVQEYGSVRGLETTHLCLLVQLLLSPKHVGDEKDDVGNVGN